MSGATCPACGVAVMPGYARCPKCRKPLPRRQSTVVPGGTAVEDKRKWPLFAAIGGGVFGIGLIIYLGTRGGHAAKPAPVKAAPQQTVQDSPNTPVDTSTPTFRDEPVRQATGPDPTALAAGLERDLKRQRLWANVTISGSQVEVRSASCGEPAMTSMLDGAASGFKAAGLTKLRCVEQSGQVVSDRDL